MTVTDSIPLILASTSPYRKQLLERLHMPFTCIAPDFQESTATHNMNLKELVKFNTMGKARSVFQQHPQSRIIASDQLATCDHRVLGKPGGFEAACAQLSSMSGKCVSFLTGLTVIDAQQTCYQMIPFQVHMRDLSAHEIEHYLHLEQPFDCAGSFKSEGLGISLFESMQGNDPTALIGLPLIALAKILQPLNKTNPKQERSSPTIRIQPK